MFVCPTERGRTGKVAQCEGWPKSCKLIENALVAFVAFSECALHVSRVVQLWLSQIRSTNILKPLPSPLHASAPAWVPWGTKRAVPPPGNTITDFKTKTKHTRLSRLATSSGLKLSRLSRQLANPPPHPKPPLIYPSLSIMTVCVLAALKVTPPAPVYVYVHFHFRDLFALRMARVEAGLARLLPSPLARPCPASPG